MQAKITKRNVDALRPGQYIADPEVRGLVARCLPSGSVTYGFRYRNQAGEQLLAASWDCMARSRPTKRET